MHQTALVNVSFTNLLKKEYKVESSNLDIARCFNREWYWMWEKYQTFQSQFKQEEKKPTMKSSRLHPTMCKAKYHTSKWSSHMMTVHFHTYLSNNPKRRKMCQKQLVTLHQQYFPKPFRCRRVHYICRKKNDHYF